MQNIPWINKKTISLTVILLILLLVGWLLSRYSYIEVSVVNASGKEISYEITRQGSKASNNVSTKKTYKKLVSRGSYEILTKSNSQSYFAVVNAKGFLTKESVTATLKPEKQRDFIGNTPNPCMHLANSVLLSYSCGGDVSTVYMHVPADQSTPTYTKPIESEVVGRTEGIFTFNNNTYIAVKSPEETDDQAPHAVYLYSNEGLTGNPYILKGLDDTSTYTINSYSSGFLAVSENKNKAVYFSDLNGEPKNIDISYPDKNNTDIPYDLDAKNNTIIVGFSKNKAAANKSEDSIKSPKIDSSIIVIKNGNKKVYKFDKLYEDIQICGDQKICLYSDNELLIYNVSSGKQKLVSKVMNVNGFVVSGSDLIIARDNEVINMNIEKQNGFIDYSYGKYQNCGIQNSEAGYILCVTNSRDDNSALFISKGTPNSIDKYVSELLKIPEIKSISAYGNYVFISPDLGTYEYNDSTNSFGYNEITKKRVNSLIDEKIKSLNADPKYQFINPLQ